MQNATKDYYQLLCGKLLKSISRSFYLTLHVLPKPVREPICLGYLLARCTDTIADTPNLSVYQRLQAITTILQLINKQTSLEQVVVIQNIIKPGNFSDNELNLLNHFGQLLDWLFTLDHFSQTEIIKLLNKIIHGQQLDIERFYQTNTLVGIKTVSELEEYTYLVAGCVGEFWTNICDHYLPNYSTMNAQELQPHAIAFGKGLQLINILRDFTSDYRENRCYLPEEQLQQYEIPTDQLLTQTKSLEPILHFWHNKAAHYLNDGWQYILSINNRRIRYAILIPLLLGYKTLHLLENGDYLNQERPVKVSHTQVKVIMVIAVIGALPKKIAYYFYKFFYASN